MDLLQFFLSTSLAISILTLGVTYSEELSTNEINKLTKELEELAEIATADAESRYSAAYKAFRAASSSQDGAIALYEACMEKIEFEDRERKSSEFREWKRRQRDRLKDPVFQLALRYQLQWLTLTLEVERTPEKEITEFATKAMDQLALIYSNAEKIAGLENQIEKDVINSVFARAYKVNKLTRNWPSNPSRIDEIFDSVILRKYKEEQDLEGLRKAWMQKLHFLTQQARYWGQGRLDTRNAKEDQLILQLNKFMQETLPNHRWSMEQDLFTHGDQKQAAHNMLEIIRKHRGHVNRETWVTQLQSLLNPPQDEANTAEEEFELTFPNLNPPAEQAKNDQTTKKQDPNFPNLEK